MGRHNRLPEPPPRYQPPARRCSIAKEERQDWYGQLAGIGIGAGVIAGAALFSGAAVLAGIPMDLSSPPTPSVQHPVGPSWMPGAGVGLHASPGFNPLFRSDTLLDASVASDPDVLRAALSQPLSDLSSLAPLGHWTAAGRWVSTDPIVRPTYPCPSPVLDPVGFRAWFARFFPGHPVPTSPVTAPAQPPAAPPASPPAATPPAAPVESVPEPVAAPEPRPEPVSDPAPVVVDPPAVDPPTVDVPPVTVDLPVTDPVTVDPPPIDVPPIDVPPVSVPPVDVSPVTDPVADALPDPVGDVVDQTASTLAAPVVTQQPVDANPVAPDVSKDATTGAVESPVQLSAAAPMTITATPSEPHSTSGNGEYVGKHRVENGGHLLRVRGNDRRGDNEGGRAGRRGIHRGHEAGSGGGRHDGGGKHRSDRVGKSHSEHQSHDGGHSNHGGSHGGSHGGGHGRH